MAPTGGDCIVLDLGAILLKVGLAVDKEPKVFVNSVTKAKHVKTRVFVGAEIDECKDLSCLYYQLPFQRGYLLNWELQKQILDHTFKSLVGDRPLSDFNLIVTEPYFNFQPIAESMDEVFFEEYGFKGLVRVVPSYLSQFQDMKERKITQKDQLSVVIDSGYSFTHILPYKNGRLLADSAKRINIDGKVLTNYLKEIISYRQLMVMDETHVMNQCKEDACFVSLDFNADMRTAAAKGSKNTIIRDYVLPDFTHLRRGYLKPDDKSRVKDGEQTIRLNTERFCVPELLFRPSDVGIMEMGVGEALHHVISSLPEHEQPVFYDNIVLTGGCCAFPNFRERLFMEIRSRAPDDFPVSVRLPKNPVTYPWHGGCSLAHSQIDLDTLLVSKQSYKELGASICSERFSEFT